MNMKSQKILQKIIIRTENEYGRLKKIKLMGFYKHS